VSGAACPISLSISEQVLENTFFEQDHSLLLLFRFPIKTLFHDSIVSWEIPSAPALRDLWMMLPITSRFSTHICLHIMQQSLLCHLVSG